MHSARSTTLPIWRSGKALLSAILAALLVASLVAAPTAPAQEQPGVALPSAEAAQEMLDQLDAIEGPVTLADLTPVDGLGPPPWTSFLPGRDQSTVQAWAEIARRTSQSRLAERQVPGVMPIYEELEPNLTTGDNEDPASGELIAGLGSGAGDNFDTRLFGALIPQFPEPNCPSVEDDGSIELATATVIGVLTELDLCGGFIGDGPHGLETGDSDFFAYNLVQEGDLMIFDVGSFDPGADLPDVVTAIYNSAGELIATTEDGGADFLSTFLEVPAPATDFYYVSVTGCCANQTDPTDPTTVPGPTTTGEYLAFMGAFPAFGGFGECDAQEPNDATTEASIVEFIEAPIVECFGGIGDGDHGDTGDYDFYELPELPAGSPVIIDVLNGDFGPPDAASVVVSVYDSAGIELVTALDENDDDAVTLEFTYPDTASYFVAIGGCCLPTTDPFTPGSGPGPVDGPLETGPYSVVFVVLPQEGDGPPPPPPGVDEVRLMTQLNRAKVAAGPSTPAASSVLDAQRWADSSAYLTSFQASFQDAPEQVACRSVEDDGSRAGSNQVTYSGTGQAICTGSIGDAQEETGDFDLYALGDFTFEDFGEVLVGAVIPPIDEGPGIDGPIIVPIPGAGQQGIDGPSLDAVVEIIDSTGEVIATSDAFQPGVAGVFFGPINEGPHWARVSGLGSSQANPDDSSSGDGPGSTGDYVAAVFRTGTSEPEVGDIDTFLVDLEAGDVLRVGLEGAFQASIIRPDGSIGQGSFSSASFIYPRISPLRHFGNTGTEHVAEVTGRHAIAITGGGGPYEAELRVVRPGLTYEEGSDTQILWIDFDGAEVDPSIWDPFSPPTTATLSPLADFLENWGLDASDEDAVIDAVIATVEEDYNGDLPATGGNGDRDTSGTPGEFDVEIRNSRDHGDLWGQPNVTRLIVGGTIEEFGIPTIGIAQSIDPGNFDTEESAVILLDLLSLPVDPEIGPEGPTLNQYAVAEGASKIDLVGRGVGAITSHEAGHVLGGWHTETFNETINIMDAGGDLDAIAGVGPDRIWGTADDVDIDHVTDVYEPFEGFFGTENLAVRMAQGLSTGRTAPDGGGDDLEPGFYRIQNSINDGYLHADGTTNVDTIAVPDAFTQWELIADGDSWLLRNTGNSFYLDADFAPENFNVELSQVPGADDRWTITGDGLWTVQNDETQRFMRALGGVGGNVDQTPIAGEGAATDWIFEPVEVDPGDGFVGQTISLQNRVYNRWLDADGGDEGFNADTSATESIQTLWAVSDAGNGFVYLRNLGTNRFLDSDADGDVDTSVAASSDDRWEIVDVGEGYYTLRSIDRNQFLDADGAGNDFDVNQSANAGDDDEWQIIVAEVGG